MAYEYRSAVDYFYGQLSAAATISTTTLSSPAFASLPGGLFSTALYLPLVLSDQTLGVKEIVWITGHASSSTDVTVERGKEGTSARAWPSATQIYNGPTVRDGNGLLARASLPTDAAVGQVYVLTDEGFAVVKTYSQSWQALVGIANPGSYGKTRAGAAIGSTQAIIARGGTVSGTTDSSGQVQVTYNSAFGGATLYTTVSWISGGAGGFYSLGVVSGSHTTTGFKVFLYNGSTGATAGAGVSVAFDYHATGY
jgi:hypothetical protein